jgi:DNA-binding NarL/FixJ family response regulator
MIRILIADDHELVREGLVSVLQESHADWKVVGQATNGRQAIDLAESLRPDVVTVDLSMPELNGLQVTEHLTSTNPGIKVLVLSVHMAHPVMRQLRRAGANAFLAKNEAPRKLVAAIEIVLSGEPFFASDSAMRAACQLSPEEQVPVQYLLTPREMEVLRLLARGLSNKEIASQLDMSVRTTESHRADIMDRLSAASLGEIVKLAIRDGVV